MRQTRVLASIEVVNLAERVGEFVVYSRGSAANSDMG